MNSSSCSTFSPVGRAEDECDHAQVPSLSPPPPTLAYPASSVLHPEQNRVPATTLLSEAPRIMRLADRCTFSLSEKNRSVLKLRFLSVKSSSMGWQHFTKPQRLEVPSPLPCFVMSSTSFTNARLALLPRYRPMAHSKATKVSIKQHQWFLFINNN